MGGISCVVEASKHACLVLEVNMWGMGGYLLLWRQARVLGSCGQYVQAFGNVCCRCCSKSTVPCTRFVTVKLSFAGFLVSYGCVSSQQSIRSTRGFRGYITLVRPKCLLAVADPRFLL